MSKLKIILLSLMFAFTHDVIGKSYYRYINEHGVTVLDDRMPAKYIKQGYEIVNENGKVIEKILPTRTEAELKKDAKMRLRREQQERIQQEREAHDRVLLKTFSNIEDIIRVRDNKLKALDTNIEIINGTLSRLRDQLDNKRRSAQQLEQSGKIIPAVMESDIEDLQAQIKNNDDYIAAKNQEKAAIKIKAAVDLKRYRELVGERSLENNRAVVPKRSETKHFTCQSLAACNRVWSLSQIFVQENSTTSIQLVTSTLIATAQPKQITDLSLAVARRPLAAGAADIELEVHCHLSEAGEELCNSRTVTNLYQRFYRLLEASVAKESPTSEQ